MVVRGLGFGADFPGYSLLQDGRTERHPPAGKQSLRHSAEIVCRHAQGDRPYRNRSFQPPHVRQFLRHDRPLARNKVFRGEVRRVVQPVRCVGQSLPSFDHMERSRDRASGHHLPAGQRKSLLDRRVSRNRGTVMSRHAALSVCRPGNRTVEAAHRTTDAIPPP